MKTLLIGAAVAFWIAVALSIIVPCLCPFKSPLACRVYCL
jgi:hypothetical protein